jgi:hypothetical protein
MNDELRQREFAERFGAALETWRFEVNSYWTRTSYFAIFQAGAFTGLWKIFSSREHLYTSIALSVAGLVLTVIWGVNNIRMHQYVMYWWNRAGDIEEEFEVCAERSLVRDYEKIREQKQGVRRLGQYSWWVNAVPAVFLSGWLSTIHCAQAGCPTSRL